VLGPEAVRPCDQWEVIDLPRGFRLAHCPTLPVERVGDWTLLGIAVQTDPARPEPAVELATSQPSTASWAGRWILVGPDRIVLDAAGTLGCFYRTVDGGLFVSSSPELLRRLEPELPRPREELRYESGFDWYPPPESGIDGVHRLLPSQALRLDGGVEARPLGMPRADLEYGEALDLLGSRLRAEIEALADLHANIALPLSGGRDSRLILATATASRVPVSPFTFELAGMARGDRELPPRLAEATGRPHRMIRRAPLRRERLDVFEEHTAGHVVDVARDSYASGQWEHVHASLELAGGALSVGKAPYRKLPAKRPESADEMASALRGALPSPNDAAVEAWTRWMQRAWSPAVDWRDAFFIDQRLGGWMSSINQGLDLNGTTRVHVGNSADLFMITLGLREAVRERFLHEEHLIARLAPALAAYPFNPESSVRRRLHERLAREREMYDRYGAREYLSARARNLKLRRSLRRIAEE